MAIKRIGSLISMAKSTDSPLPDVGEFFSPEGLLASGGAMRFEPRAGQVKMAAAVEQALTDGNHLIVEAGTGTGKTMAYLYPAIRHAQISEVRVIISTGTKHLQEQIVFKDIPALKKIIGEFKVSYLKGRSNYLCVHKFARVQGKGLFADQVAEYDAIDEWADRTETGDRAELTSLPETSSLWKRINARSESCVGKSCADYDDCFMTRARARAEQANVVIVNHHLFFADLMVRMKNPHASILPKASAVVFDEAHELEAVASGSFSVSMSKYRIADLASDVYRVLGSAPRSAEIYDSCGRLADQVSFLLDRLPVCHGSDRVVFDDRANFLERNIVHYENVLTSLDVLQSQLERVRGSDEAMLLCARVDAISTEMRYLFEADASLAIIWIERRPAQKPGMFNTFITATPITVADILRTSLFVNFSSVILCSATLAVQNKFVHVRKALGIDKADSLVVSSPFHYKTQTALYLPPDMPDPRDENCFGRSLEVTEQVLRVTKGRAFCLFTSYKAMIRMHAALEERIPFPLLLHGNMSRKELLSRFRSTPNAVLFGTSSFWQGVDVQGDQLSCVIIDRLPFAVPTDPIVLARMKAIEQSGGNSFFDYQIPQAVIALKQGFGRLVRSTQDHGILAILDPRVRHPRYGRVFLDSLPDYTITSDLKVAAEFLKPPSLKT